MDQPWMKSLTLTSASQNYNLFTLMQALDSKAPPNVEAVQIQLDVDAGAARLRIGNTDMDDSNYGVLLFASQAFTVQPASGNILPLKDIFLRCDTPGLEVHVVAVVR